MGSKSLDDDCYALFPIRPSYILSWKLHLDNTFKRYSPKSNSWLIGITAGKIIELCQASKIWEIRKAGLESKVRKEAIDILVANGFLVRAATDPPGYLLTKKFVTRCFRASPLFRSVTDLLKKAKKH